MWDARQCTDAIRRLAGVRLEEPPDMHTLATELGFGLRRAVQPIGTPHLVLVDDWEIVLTPGLDAQAEAREIATVLAHWWLEHWPVAREVTIAELASAMLRGSIPEFD